MLTNLGVLLSMSKDLFLLLILEITEYKFSILMGHFCEHSDDGDKMMESSKDWKELPLTAREIYWWQIEKITVFRYFRISCKDLIYFSCNVEPLINTISIHYTIYF